MLRGAGGQLRVGMGGAFALDWTAVIAAARLRGAATAMLAEVLPAVEAAILRGLKSDDE